MSRGPRKEGTDSCALCPPCRPPSVGAARETEAWGNPAVGGPRLRGPKRVVAGADPLEPPCSRSAGSAPRGLARAREPPVSMTTEQAWAGWQERCPVRGQLPQRAPRGLPARPASAPRDPGRHGATPAAAAPRAPRTHLQHSPPPPPPPRSGTAPTPAVSRSQGSGLARGAPPAGRSTAGAGPLGAGPCGRGQWEGVARGERRPGSSCAPPTGRAGPLGGGASEGRAAGPMR